MGHTNYPHLFEPLKVNRMILKNRIISAPLGSLTDKSISGIGMIIRGTSGCVNDGRSRITPGPYCFATPALCAEVREQVSIIRQRGAKAEFELCHVGQYAKVEPDDYAIGPVGFIRKDGTEVREMNEDMMKYIADKFAEAALDAKEYGFDMVMLHFAHGWLPAQFLSPYFNKRTDEYGGSFENRIKFPTMIVDRVRKAVGRGYPLDMRISGFEHVDGAMDPDEIVRFIKSIEDKIDMVHISCGMERDMEANVHLSTTYLEPHKYNIGWSKKVKEAVKIPVAVVGAIMTPEEGEEIIASGYADAVVIGRSIIADPFWVKKAWESRSEDIVPCLRCLNCYAMYASIHISGIRGLESCAVNPRYLREHRVPVKLALAEKKKRVVVIGGGPAGIKAALTAEERGHEVILLEKEGALGGQTRCADYDKYKLDLKRYKDYLITQLGKSNVDVRMNTEATPELVKSMKPDTIIVAVGAAPAFPPIKGINNGNVITAVDSYFGLDNIGKNVIIIGGGGIGCELSLLLAEYKHNITIIEVAPKLNLQSNISLQIAVNQKIRKYENIKCLTSTACLEIQKDGVIVLQTGEIEKFIPADTVIIATGMKAKRDLAQSFFGIVQDVNIIGDCDKPGTVLETTEDGYFVAATL